MSRRRKNIPPPPTLTDEEAFEILETPIEESVLQGEAVVLAPYAEKLFELMASWMPKVTPSRGPTFVQVLFGERIGLATAASATYAGYMGSESSVTIQKAAKGFVSVTVDEHDGRAELKSIMEMINKHKEINA